MEGKEELLKPNANCSAIGTKQTCSMRRRMSAIGGKADSRRGERCPKNELIDLVWLAFRGRDGEEARYLPTSPELEAFFIDLGFSPSVAEKAQGKTVMDPGRF